MCDPDSFLSLRVVVILNNVFSHTQGGQGTEVGLKGRSDPGRRGEVREAQLDRVGVNGFVKLRSVVGQ
jgi:hypothetical protein